MQRIHRRSVMITMMLLAAGLGACATTAPADLAAAVQVFNVYRTGGEALPRTVDGCEFLGSASASVPTTTEANSVSVGFYDPSPLLETIRLRAHRKGADTVFVAIAPQASLASSPEGGEGLLLNERTLRATLFHCGTSPAPAAVGVPIRG